MALRGKFGSRCEMEDGLECIEMRNVVLHGINGDEPATRIWCLMKGPTMLFCVTTKCVNAIDYAKPSNSVYDLPICY